MWQSEWKKYQEYAIEVDPDEDDRAVKIKICSYARPHMRAFHWAWLSLFAAALVEVTIAPPLGWDMWWSSSGSSGCSYDYGKWWFPIVEGVLPFVASFTLDPFATSSAPEFP